MLQIVGTGFQDRVCESEFAGALNVKAKPVVDDPDVEAETGVERDDAFVFGNRTHGIAKAGEEVRLYPEQFGEDLFAIEVHGKKSSCVSNHIVVDGFAGFEAVVSKRKLYVPVVFAFFFNGQFAGRENVPGILSVKHLVERLSVIVDDIAAQLNDPGCFGYEMLKALLWTIRMQQVRMDVLFLREGTACCTTDAKDDQQKAEISEPGGAAQSFPQNTELFF